MLDNIDLVTLKVFQQLMIDRSRSKAANNMGYRVSNIAYHLDKLTDKTGDILFEKEGNRLIPTSRANTLYETVKTVINLLEDEFAVGENFSHMKSAKHFNVVVEEYFSMIAVPQLLGTISAVSEDITVSIEVVQSFHNSAKNTNGSTPPAGASIQNNLRERLISGDIDILISSVDCAVEGDNIMRQKVMSDSMVTVYNEEYSSVLDKKQKKLTLADIQKNAAFMEIRQGTSKGANSLSSYNAMLNATREQLFYAQVPRRLFERVEDGNLAAIKMPGQKYEVHQFWHNQNKSNPAHQWLRRLVKSTCKQLE